MNRIIKIGMDVHSKNSAGSADPVVIPHFIYIQIMKEKKILYVFACPSHHNTVTRLKWLTTLIVDPEAKHRISSCIYLVL